jgi:GT2 family glycosyltransferase
MVDPDGHTVPSSRRFPTLGVVFGDVTRLSSVWPSLFPPSLLPPPDDSGPVEVDQVIGAFFLIRRDVFLELGGFDERFFVYYEEVDLSLRSHSRGYRSMYLPGASALHHGGYSSDQVRAKRLFYSLRSRLLFARKHWSLAGTTALGLMTFGLELPARLVISALRAAPADVVATLRGFGMLTAWILSAGRRPLA